MTSRMPKRIIVLRIQFQYAQVLSMRSLYTKHSSEGIAVIKVVFHAHVIIFGKHKLNK